MSALTAALERIQKWLRENQPEYAASYLPGLKHEEIQSMEAEFGFKLPKEIYELYQWRNGTEKDAKALCFPTLEFLPISRAIECSKGCNQYIEENKNFSIEEREWYEISPLFTFMENNGNYCGIPLVEHQGEKIPVVDLGEGGLRIFYASLTDMILTLAECYEIGGYYLNKEGFICEDECQVAQVLRKYNADINEKALLTFRSLFLQPQDDLNSQQLNQLAETSMLVTRFKEPRVVDWLLEVLQVWSRNKDLHRDRVCAQAINILGEMCDKRALKPLTNALEDNSPLVRKEAQSALFKLK